MTRFSTAELKAAQAAVMRQLNIDCEIAYIRVKIAARRVILALKAGFDPAQPRGGHGQWARTGGGSGGAGGLGFDPNGDPTGDGGSDPAPDTTTEYGNDGDSWSSVTTTYDDNGDVVAQAVTNRDGSTIQSEFNRTGTNQGFDERHTVATPDGARITFATAGDTQTITDTKTGEVLGKTTWTDNGPEPDASVQLARFPQPLPNTVEEVVKGLGAAVTAATALFTWLSKHNDDGGAAVFSFKANEFGPGADPKLEAEWVGRVSRDDVDNACPRHGEVQLRTDAAAFRAVSDPTFTNAATYGTAVHKLLEIDINGLRDSNFRAEESFIKGETERYGFPGTIRIDVLENVRNGTVCVYDIKTGRTELSLARSAEIARAVYGHFGGTTRILVIQVKPRR